MAVGSRGMRRLMGRDHMEVVGFLSPKFLLLVLLVRRYNSINDIGVDSQ